MSEVESSTYAYALTLYQCTDEGCLALDSFWVSLASGVGLYNFVCIYMYIAASVLLNCLSLLVGSIASDVSSPPSPPHSNTTWLADLFQLEPHDVFLHHPNLAYCHHCLSNQLYHTNNYGITSIFIPSAHCLVINLSLLCILQGVNSHFSM